MLIKLHKIVYKGKLYTSYNKQALIEMLQDKKIISKRNKAK